MYRRGRGTCIVNSKDLWAIQYVERLSKISMTHYKSKDVPSHSIMLTVQHNTAGIAEINVKNKFNVGDSVKVMTPQSNLTVKVEELFNRTGESVEASLGSGNFVFLALPAGVETDKSI